MKLKELKLELFRNDLNYSQVAKLMGISYSALSNKMVARSEFTAKEIFKIKKILNLSDERFMEIFKEE